jgi:hypothetical protein
MDSFSTGCCNAKSTELHTTSTLPRATENNPDDEYTPWRKKAPAGFPPGRVVQGVFKVTAG